MARLSPDEFEALLAKMDDVCRQAQELRKTLREKMEDRAGSDLQERRGQPERRRKPR